MQILELAQYLLTLSHWSVVTNTSQVSPPISLQNCTQLPLVLAPLSAEAKSPHGSSDLAAAAAGAGAGAGAAAAGLFRSRPPRSQRRSRLGEAEAAAPITEDSGDRGSTGEDRGVRLEAPGICDKTVSISIANLKNIELISLSSCVLYFYSPHWSCCCWWRRAAA